MKIQATKTTITKLELTIRPSSNYPYVIIAPSGEIVGRLIELHHGIYRVQMIDTNYKLYRTKFSEKDFRLEETAKIIKKEASQCLENH